MYGVELLVEEHKNILYFIDITRKECENIISGKELDVDLFRDFIDFGRNYADKHHHGKEEQILFKLMLDKLGSTAEKLIKNGMYVEHDLGRLYMADLETALNKYQDTKDDAYKLDIIGNMTGYGILLRRHIDKEDNIVYSYAERELNKSELNEVDKYTMSFENDEDNAKNRIKYISWLEKFKKI